MLKCNEIRIGQFIRWTGRHRTGTWSIPARIIEVRQGQFKLRMLDKMLDTHWLEMEDASYLGEMRICTAEEAQSYCVSRLAKERGILEELLRRLCEQEIELKKYEQEIEKILSKNL